MRLPNGLIEAEYEIRKHAEAAGRLAYHAASAVQDTPIAEDGAAAARARCSAAEAHGVAAAAWAAYSQAVLDRWDREMNYNSHAGSDPGSGTARPDPWLDKCLGRD